ncbi:MAG: outer membrane beta-barrel protein [Bacteroidota bacterium]|nr:outer membrane beta-barrel protein [Bacteroidota bacterium]
MKKKLLYLVLLFAISTPGFGQTTINGSVTDPDNEPLINATVILLSPADSTMKYFGVTNEKGEFKVVSVRDGDYIMQVSYVGTESLYESITIPSEKGTDFGQIILKEESIGEVSVVAEYVPIRFRSDTVVFNADAFKTKPDAVVEDLLKKIPGIEVDVSGNIKALGEDVSKVLVDGKEFFGRDTKVATKNVPARSVENVEVLDKKSYEAEFMGIDDGVRDRTINLELREDAKAGYFGNFKAGAGTNERVQAEGRLYRFTSNIQMAGLGMYNNVNEFGFAAQGMGKFGDKVNGENRTGAGGLNFSYNPTEFNRYYISYLGSATRNILEQSSEGEYFSDAGSYQQSVLTDRETNNRPNSMDFGLHHRFNPKHNLIVRGNMDIFNNDLERIATTNTFVDTEDVNRLLSEETRVEDRLAGSVNMSYMTRLNEGNTQFKTEARFSLNHQEENTEIQNTTELFDPVSTNVVSQFIDRNTDNYFFSFNPSFVQRITSRWFLNTDVSMGMHNQGINQQQGDIQPTRTVIDSLSPDFLREHAYIVPGLTLKRGTMSSQLHIGMRTAWNRYGTELGDVSGSRETFFHLLPSVYYEWKIRTGRRLTARYNSNVNIPTAGQLLPVFSTVNPLMLTQGNSELIPEYSHNILTEISIFDQFSFTSAFFRASATYTRNKISWEQTITDELVKINRPVNVDWDYTANGYLNFSTPLRRLGIKVNLRLTENWQKGLNIVNDKENELNSLTHGVDFSIENHKKQNYDARLGASISYTDTKYSVQDELNNKYYNTVYYADLRIMPSETWNVNLTGRLTRYNSQTLNENLSIPSVDAEINYYFLKGNRGVLSLRAIDLLDKNKGFQQLSDVNYIMQINSNTMGRYILLSFSYRLTGGRGGNNTR